MPRMGRDTFSRVLILDGAGHHLQLPSLTTTQRDALAAVKGMTIWNSTTSAINQYNGTSWGTVGVSDHGALTGLTDDDHTQYWNNTRGDAKVAAEATARDVAIAVHAALFGLHNKIVRKSANQTLDQSSTTLQNVTEMLFAVGANEVWLGYLVLKYNSGTTPDLDWAWSVPSGTKGAHYPHYLGESVEGGSFDLTDELRAAGLDGDTWKGICFVVQVGATAGNVQLQAAQGVAHASDTKVLANSFIIAHQLA